MLVLGGAASSIFGVEQVAAEGETGKHFENAGHQGPGSDQVEERNGRNPRPKKHGQPGENAGDAFDEQPSPAVVTFRGPHRRGDREDAVDQRIRAEERYER